MKSLLYQEGSTLQQPAACEPCRTETVKRFVKNGKMYTMTWRDKITIEDPYMVMVKAAAFAIQMDEPYAARTPRRDYRDFIIRSSLVI